MQWAGGDLAEVVAGMFDARVVASGRVAGGDAGDAYKIRLSPLDPGAGAGFTVFAKTTVVPRPGAFAAEAAGLAWLRETNTVRTPEVLAVRDDAELAHRFIVLEWIAMAPPAPDHDERLGQALADLHRFPCARFGLDGPNFVGALPQANQPEPTWAEFYATQRLEPLVRAAVDAGRLPERATDKLQRLLGRLPDLIGPVEPPSRLHGDLWAGNAMVGPDGGPVLVDPATYGGHREMDLAMMRLFGGFGDRVFSAYHEAHPLAEGHAERAELHQLYPVLVHVNLFGGSYAGQALRILDRYA